MALGAASKFAGGAMVIAWIVVVLVVAFVAIVVTHRPGRKGKPGATPSNGDTSN